jgi:hypothetical protein
MSTETIPRNGGTPNGVNHPCLDGTEFVSQKLGMQRNSIIHNIQNVQTANTSATEQSGFSSSAKLKLSTFDAPSTAVDCCP